MILSMRAADQFFFSELEFHSAFGLARRRLNGIAQTLPLILALGSGVPARSSTQPLGLTSESGTAFELCASCPAPQIRVVVKPDRGFVPREDPVVLQVSSFKQQDTLLLSAFSAKWVQHASGGGLHAIDISVERSKIRAGTYDILLSLQPHQPNEPTLTLQVIQPAAKLAKPNQLVLERVAGMSWPEVAVPLKLWESSGRAPLTNLQIIQVKPASSSTGQVSGEVTFPDLTGKTIPPGGSAVFFPKLQGEFPLGVTTSELQITANELSEPQLLVVEVRSRLSSWFIIVPILTGLLVSWVAKVYLESSIQDGEAKRQAGELAWRIEREQIRHADKRFRDFYAEELKALAIISQRGDAASIQRAIKELETKWNEALVQLTERRNIVQPAVDELCSNVEFPWEVPPSVRTALADAQQKLSDVRTAIERDDVDAASRYTTEATRNLFAVLARDLATWTSDAQVFRQAISDVAAATLSRTIAGIWHDLEANASTEITVGMQTMLRDRLREAATVFTSHRAVLTQLKRAIRAEYGRTRAKFSPEPAIQELFDEKVGSTLCQLEQVLDRGAESPADAVAIIEDQLRHYRASWRSFIEHPEVSKADVPSIDKGQYEEAIDGAMRTIEKRKSRMLSSNQQAPERFERVTPLVIWSAGSIAGPANRSRTAYNNEQAQLPLWYVAAMSRSAILREKAKQSAIIALVAGVFGYSVFAGHFTGSASDFATVFLWAFGVDLTLDRLRALTAQSNAAPAAARP